MQVQRLTSANEFLARTADFLAAHEVENNLILWIARALSVREAPPEPPFFGIVAEGDRIAMCVFQSLPGRLGATRARDPDAIRVLVEDLAAHGPEVSFLTGPEPTAAELATGLAARTGRTARRQSRQRIHRLDAVTPLDRRAPGALRRPRGDEQDVLEAWIVQFFVEVGERGDVRTLAAHRVREGGLYVWDDGGLVSMASATHATETGVRIALVYTPPELRGRGYASACVEALSRQMIDAGNRYCCLYTDLGNPTSNNIYRRIGYLPVCDAGAYVLELKT